jgi:hypothetical protein
MSDFKISDDYTEVPERMAMVRALYPNATFRPANLDKPYSIEKIGEINYIIYTAAIYREPFDECPAIGIAWEQVPGLTPFTKGSELMNAETSAWGRACIAVGIPAKKIASAEDVRNRQSEKIKVIANEPVIDDPWAGTSTTAAPSCNHGLMVWNTGHNKSKNKDWGGYFCTYIDSDTSSEKCPPVWYVIGSDGNWKAQVK